MSLLQAKCWFFWTQILLCTHTHMPCLYIVYINRCIRRGVLQFIFGAIRAWSAALKSTTAIILLLYPSERKFFACTTESRSVRVTLLHSTFCSTFGKTKPFNSARLDNTQRKNYTSNDIIGACCSMDRMPQFFLQFCGFHKRWMQSWTVQCKIFQIQIASYSPL